ncbi:hypothetical protein BsWGS_04105 [Bradybaena similaris]
MAESLPVTLGLKRPADSDRDSSREKHKKKKKKHHVVQLGKSEGCKRKIAMLVAYNGAGYYGVQINPGFQTIESEIFPALVKAGAIPQDHMDTPSKMWFQRGSRTDKGVSAVGQIFSLKIILVPDLVSKMNEVLPPQIRVIGYTRTTNGFDSKNWCDSRTYTYMTPTYAFAPLTKFITDEYRVEADILPRLRTVLNKFVGTHKFHNFTSGVKYEQACASRYIIKFECSEPYVREGIEFVTLEVKGQSFMLHHIRKMTGLAIAILRGYCGESTIEASWGPDKVDIPKAPGLGLVLETLHLDGYNKRFGSDGVHEPINWTQYQETLDKFKEEHIISYIVSQEKTERVMFNWLRTLQFHNFDQPRLEGPQRPWVKVVKMLSAKSPEQGENQGSDVQTCAAACESRTSNSPVIGSGGDSISISSGGDSISISSGGDSISIVGRSTPQLDESCSADRHTETVTASATVGNCQQQTRTDTSANENCQQQPLVETLANENCQQQPLVETLANENCQQQPLVETLANENCQQQPLVETLANENCQQQPLVETLANENCQQQPLVETLANENCQQQPLVETLANENCLQQPLVETLANENRQQQPPFDTLSNPDVASTDTNVLTDVSRNIAQNQS